MDARKKAAIWLCVIWDPIVDLLFIDQKKQKGNNYRKINSNSLSFLFPTQNRVLWIITCILFALKKDESKFAVSFYLSLSACGRDAVKNICIVLGLG